MADQTAAAGISVTVATMMLSGFSTFLPPLREVRQASPNDPTMRNDVRHGQMSAGVMALGIGALMSWLGASPVPLYVAFAATLLYATIYELALQNGKV